MDAIHPGPAVHDVADLGVGDVGDRGLDEVLEQVEQAGVAAHLGGEAGEGAVAAQRGEKERVGDDGDRPDIEGEGLVHAEPDIGDGAGPAGGPGEGGGVGDRVAGDGLRRGQVDRGEADGGDAGGAEGLQLVGLGDAIAVEVAPDAQVGEAGVGGGDAVVGVAVEQAKRGEAVGGGAAEEFVAGLDAAVAVEVDGKQGIIGADPADALDEAVIVEVEEGGGGGDGDQVEAVAVEVDDERGNFFVPRFK